jgi:hypothetical protein
MSCQSGDPAILKSRQFNVRLRELISEFAFNVGDDFVAQRRADVLVRRVLRRFPKPLDIEIGEDANHFLTTSVLLVAPHYDEGRSTVL